MTLKKNLFAALVACCAVAMISGQLIRLLRTLAWRQLRFERRIVGFTRFMGWLVGFARLVGFTAVAGVAMVCGSCGSYGGGYAYYGGYYDGGYASSRVDVRPRCFGSVPATTVVAARLLSKPV